MFLNTQQRGSHEIGPGQITKIGHRMRRMKIDEIPQIWSVLKGDMSFVGPRPGLPIQLELTRERAKLGVYSVRPGITGPAQLAGIDMSTPRELAIVDATYIKQSSIIGDLRILAATAFGFGRGDTATKG